MKVIALKTQKVAHPNPCLASMIRLTEDKEYEVDDDMGKRLIDYGCAKKVSIIEKTVEKVVKKVTKKGKGK